MDADILRSIKVFKHFFIDHEDFKRDVNGIESEIIALIRKEMKSFYVIEYAITKCLEETFEKYTLKNIQTKPQVIEYLKVLYKRIIENTHKSIFPNSIF